MKKNSAFSALMLSAAAFPICLGASNPALSQELESFAVIAGQTLTNTGPTTIIGNIAVSPGTAYTGSGSVTQTGSTFLADAVAVRMQNDLTTLYTYLSGLPTKSGGNLTGQELGGLTLTPGVYNFDTSALLSAGQTLILDAQGDPDALFIFNIGSTLTVGSGASIRLEGAAQGGNVFYRVGSSATLNTTADLDGQIVALTSITMNTFAEIDCGSAFARNGSVTLDTNRINVCVLDSGGFEEEPVDETPVDETPVVDVPAVVIPAAAATVLSVLADVEREGGTLPLVFAILPATQTPAQLAVTLSQLTGEVSTGVAPMITHSMNTFLDTVSRPIGPARMELAAPRDQGVPAGMVPNRDVPYTAKFDTGKFGSAPEEPLTYQAIGPMQPNDWSIWMSGYGARSTIDGDDEFGTHDNTIDTTGFAFGLDYLPDASTRIGVAFALDSGDFELSDGFGSGTTEGRFVAVHGSRTFDQGYVSGVLAYGQSDFTTQRLVTIAGSDLLAGEETATNVAAQIEAGYHMRGFTPFVGLRAQSVQIPAYTETAVSGTSSYALSYAKQTAQSLRSEVGVAASLVESEAGSLDVRASWAHEFASPDAGVATFQAIPGVGFDVTGTEQDRDSLIVSVRGEFGNASGFFAGANLNAQYSGNFQDYGGNLTVGYRW